MALTPCLQPLHLVRQRLGRSDGVRHLHGCKLQLQTRNGGVRHWKRAGEPKPISEPVASRPVASVATSNHEPAATAESFHTVCSPSLTPVQTKQDFVYNVTFYSTVSQVEADGFVRAFRRVLPASERGTSANPSTLYDFNGGHGAALATVALVEEGFGTFTQPPTAPAAVPTSGAAAAVVTDYVR